MNKKIKKLVKDSEEPVYSFSLDISAVLYELMTGHNASQNSMNSIYKYKGEYYNAGEFSADEAIDMVDPESDPGSIANALVGDYIYYGSYENVSDEKQDEMVEVLTNMFLEEKNWYDTEYRLDDSKKIADKSINDSEEVNEAWRKRYNK